MPGRSQPKLGRALMKALGFAALTLILMGFSWAWNPSVQERLDACPRSGCTVDLAPGVYEVDPLTMGRMDQKSGGWTLKGAGAGVFSSGKERTVCGTTLRLKSEGEALLEVVNFRHFKVLDLCLDVNGMAHGALWPRCNQPNCGGLTIENVVVGGFREGDADSYAIRAIDDETGPVAIEHVDLRHFEVQHIRNNQTLALPRTAIDLNLRNADHWTVYSSAIGFSGPGCGVRVRNGNMTWIESVIVSSADSSGNAVCLENFDDRLSIIGLITEMQGTSGGIKACKPDGNGGCAAGTMTVGIVGSEIKVPRGTKAIDWQAGGSLSIEGSAIGWHGGGAGRIGVSIGAWKHKKLQLSENLYRMSLVDFEFGEGVER